ncbi:zinc finger protein CG2199 isoform X2 [Drosophila hydei]|nr:zinc finger protein CG2199 isoform X2 [Drosophila hydei]
MSGNVKKELILCDYCQIGKDSNQIYTTRKQFAGCKIVDILQNVTQRIIPVTTPIKLCSLCASTLHATTGAIARAIEMVSKLLPASKKQVQIETVLIPDEEADDEPTKSKSIRLSTVDVQSPKVPAKQTEVATPNKSIKKIIKEANSTPTGVQQSPKKLPAKAKQPQTSTPIAVPPSTPKKQQDVEMSLQNAVKVTAAKEAPKKNNEFNQLFGSHTDTVSDSEDEDEDEEDGTAIGNEKAEAKNIAMGFECKLCDFKSTYPNPMKKHLKELHGQKRPRIYNCLKCTKCFGVLKSLKGHLLTHGITEQSDEKQTVADPQLAVLTALKPKQKPIVNSEDTVDLTNTNSPILKPAGVQGQPDQQSTKFQCEMCQLDLNTVKSLQDHLKTVHNIERPKAFKCDACESHFMYKTTMDRHYRVKHMADDGTETAKKQAAPVKIKLRRKTIAVESNVIAKEINMEDSTTQTSFPIKITARRKTITSEVNKANESPIKISKQSPIKNPKQVSANGEKVITEAIDGAIEGVIDELMEDLPTPNQSKPKVVKFGDSATVADTPKKLKKPTQVLKESFESLLESPSKNKSKSKGEQILVTPTKQSSKAIDELELISPIQNDKSQNNIDLQESLISKKSKAKNEIDTLDSSQTIENGTPSKKIKTQKDTLNLSQTISINGSAKKSSKRKLREEETSQVDADDEAEVSIASKSLKKSKADKLKQADIDTIELLDEINPNVKPHKRTKLDSMELSESELSCSVCSKVVGSRKRLDAHILKKHTIKLTCPNCKVVYTDNLEYVKHFSFCNAVDGLPCGIKNCEKVFAAANFLCSHLNKKHKSTQ